MSRNYRSRLPGLSWPDLPQGQPPASGIFASQRARAALLAENLVVVWLMLIASVERSHELRACIFMYG